MEDRKNEVEKQEQERNVSERPGSGDHNDYRMKGDEQTKERDEEESYTDYNGNSEANDPARAK